jgi:hypothetical protein
LSPLRKRFSGFTRSKKPRFAIGGSAALEGADKVVTRGSGDSARAGGRAAETSCALFRTASAGNFTTSVFAEAGVTFVGVGLDPWVADSTLDTFIGAGFGRLGGDSDLGRLAIRVTFVTASFGAATVEVA